MMIDVQHFRPIASMFGKRTAWWIIGWNKNRQWERIEDQLWTNR